MGAQGEEEKLKQRGEKKGAGWHPPQADRSNGKGVEFVCKKSPAKYGGSQRAGPDLPCRKKHNHTKSVGEKRGGEERL